MADRGFFAEDEVPPLRYLQDLHDRVKTSISKSCTPNTNPFRSPDPRQVLDSDGDRDSATDYPALPRGRRHQRRSLPQVPERPRSQGYAKPPRFNGRNMGWDEFISQFQAVAQINRWEDPELGQHLFVNLEGEARSYVVGLRLPTWDYFTLVTKLEGWFGSAFRKEAFRHQLQNRRRDPKEPATSYVADIGRLVSQAYPGVPDDILREFSIKYIIEGLPDGDLKHELVMHSPESIEATVRLIERFENSVRKTRPLVRAVAKDEGKEIKELLEKILHMLERKEPEQNSKHKPSGKEEKTCYGCGEVGHFKNKCPLTNQKKPGNQ